MGNVEEQQQHLSRLLQRRGISDPRVLAAIARTRRDLFVPEELRHLAYEDTALAIGEEQTISQPYIVALMTQELALNGDELVLEVGTGSGYQAAILAQLCRAVVTIERLPSLSERAQMVLAELGFTNIEYRIGDGTLGCPDRAPFDGVIVTAAAPDVPAPLFRQLKLGGRLVAPIGEEPTQMLTLIIKREPEPIVRNLCECRFVRLIGEAGWPAEVDFQ
jgi:protein-L-isoaspartate(D-aspartate) O-methyltransferase